MLDVVRHTNFILNKLSDMYTFNSLNILLASTEIILFGLILFLLSLCLLEKVKSCSCLKRFLASLFVLGFYMVIGSFSNPTVEYGFNGMYVIDPISLFSKGFICIVFALALFYCEQFLNLMKIPQSEFFFYLVLVFRTVHNDFR